MKETKYLKFFESFNEDFLMSVSAFSNYEGGTIKFGIAKSGEIVGINNIDEIIPLIESLIENNIVPKPSYKFRSDYKRKVLSLIIEEGSYKPYLYNNDAYKRNDFKTYKVNEVELNRLKLEGLSINFDAQEIIDKNLTFEVFKDKLDLFLNINLSDDLLKVLGLITINDKYTNAASIISDNNNFPGVEITKYGRSQNEINEFEVITNKSIFILFDEAYKFYQRYYQYQLIDSKTSRKIFELVPEEAFKEAFANALIHRSWDENSSIKVEMFEDKITIYSPGGLLKGVSKEDYLNGKTSKLRNPILAYVFYRLRYIDLFGNGISKIKELYKDMHVKPYFEVNEDSIIVTLPAVDKKVPLTKDEGKILDYLNKGNIASSSELASITGYSKNKVVRIVNSLLIKNYIESIGNGRGIKYKS